MTLAVMSRCSIALGGKGCGLEEGEGSELCGAAQDQTLPEGLLPSR